MLTSQLQVQLTDGTAEGDGSEFLVHVNGISAGQVSEVNAEVLDAGGVLLEDLAGRDDFTLDLADLVLTLHEVPKLGPSKDLVASEDSHSVEFGLWDFLAWQSSSDNVKLSNLQ